MRGLVDSETQSRQARAIDPRASAWVSANAGSGKTYVLSRRVIRLLLAGVDPARILCLTFTKAAASEMANRVFAELGRWTTLDDATLAAEIERLEGTRPDERRLAAARRLFARALDTPGGLKIQTIHAFCERLLHQFPFEANVPGHFQVLDDRNQAALLAEAQRSVLAEAAAHPQGVLGRALDTILDAASDAVHEVSVREFVARRDRLQAWVDSAGNLEAAIAALGRELGVQRGETSDALFAEIVTGSRLAGSDGRRLLSLLEGGGKSDQAAGERLARFLETADIAARADALRSFLLTDQGDPRRRIATAAVTRQWYDLDGLLDAEQQRFVALDDRLRTVALFETSAAMLRLAGAAINAYATLKHRRGLLDFEDLVVRTAFLLKRAAATRWVQYKLDRGLDHILVDEAQDTSPRQWQVVTALVEEFFAGEGAAAAGNRTVFAVGDEKQSIFSFQGAVPAWFDRVRGELGDSARGAGYPWEDLNLHLSFRSVPCVLAAVDRTFSTAPAHVGLSAEAAATVHTAFRRHDPGRVVLWPLIEKPEKQATSDWTAPLDSLGQESPEVQLSRRIATTIAGWIADGAVLDAPDSDGNPRPIRPGGILILVRTRGALNDAINRELKNAGVPIAGADRIRLTEHIAVMDLIALGRVMLLPEDDLALASILKSPLLGLDEDDLFRLAHDRKERSLWASLAEKAGVEERYATVFRRLRAWRQAADSLDPHAFYARVLGADGGRRNFLRRLGMEAEDVIDEFLAQALAFEQTSVPTLEAFLGWIEAGDTDIKRDTDTLRDEVRVMTVHGAKGLEADVVFLIDNGTQPWISGHDPRMLPLRDDHDPDNPGPVVWMRKVGAMPSAVRAHLERHRKRSEEEYRRLLYVGMTRARDWLYVVGMVKQKNKEEEDNRWHKLIERALGPELEDVTDAAGNVIERRWQAPETPAHRVAPVAAIAPDDPVPAWATTPAASAPEPLRRITPSTAAAAADDAARAATTRAMFAARPGTDAERALERGRVVHRLLESLPDLPPDARAARARAYCEAFGGILDEAEREACVREVMAVLDDPRFAAAFAPGSRAEVEIAGTVTLADGSTASVAGRIDRLAVTGDRVTVVDFKTNRPAPTGLADTPPAYIAQLALYRAVLRQLYPGKIVAASLLWTDGPALMEVPQSALDAAEAALSR